MLIEKTASSGKADSTSLRILESIPDGFFSVDSNWRIRYCNRNSEKILGIPKESMTGQNLWDCFPGCGHLKFYSELHKAMELHQPVFFEEYYKPLQLWAEVSASFAEGLLSIYFKDISFQKEQERRLKEMNDRHTLLLNFISEVIWEWEIGAPTATWHGDNLARLLDYDLPNQGSVQFWEKSIHPDDQGNIKNTLRTAIQKGEAFYTNQYRVQKKNGEYIFVRDRAHIIRNSKGEAVKVIGITDDITVQKLYEEALIRAKTSYHSLFENAPLPQWIYDRDTLRFLDVNAAAIKHYGYSYDEFQHMTLLEIRPKKDWEKTIETVAHRNIDGVVNRGIWTHIKKNGQSILVEVSLTLMQYQNKTVHLATLNDVTEKLNLQEQLTNEKLRQQRKITKATIEAGEKERTQIGKDLHDNVNQILTTAKLYAENIKYFPEQKEAFVDKSVALLQKAISEIRHLSKALVTPCINEIGLTNVLTEMMGCYKQLNLFEIDFKIETPVEKAEKEIRLTVYRIIQEQLNNIVKYAKASFVKVYVLVQKQNILVHIEDNGVGFDLIQKKTGLGLNNIKNRAELFNGKVKIESAPGKGCKMEIAFPFSTTIQNKTNQKA